MDGGSLMAGAWLEQKELDAALEEIKREKEEEKK